MRGLSNFFDFIFYRTYCFYKNNGERDIPGVSALCVVTLLQLLNVSSIIFILIDLFKVKDWDYSKPLLYACFLLVMAFNYYRVYRQIGLLNLIETWKKAEIARKNRFRAGMIIYLIATIALVIATIT